MNTERKSIFITGAACGMGQATARKFANEGWYVGICDVDKEGLEALASELGTANCYSVILDVTDKAAYKKVLEAFDKKAGGRLDVLYNNAGIIKWDLFGNMDIEDIERILQVNLMGVVYGIHAAYPMLAKTPNSLCFTTSSSSAIFGSAGLAAYSTSKHAVKGLTEALSVEFSVIDSRAADTQPGHIKTGMMTEDYLNNLPEKGPFRLIPAEVVADTVWAAYHDTTGRLHWYVPEDLEEYQKWVAHNIEKERNNRVKSFGAQIEQNTGLEKM